MKLGQAQKVAREYLDRLYQKKRELSQLLQKEPTADVGGSFDRVELTKTLTVIEEEYERMRAVAQELTARHVNIQNAEIARQQCEAAVEAAEDMMKILEVFRRIAKGDRVPPADEKKLMDYSMELYAAAKNMAMMNRNEDCEEHDSIWDEDAAEETPVDPVELADNAEVGNVIPPSAAVESVSSSAETI